MGKGYYDNNDDEIWSDLREFSKQKHKERVAKTPDRIKYAIEQFKKNDIKYVLKNENIGHFHCYTKKDNKLVQFYASTGKIQGYDNIRGINALIKLLVKGKTKQ